MQPKGPSMVTGAVAVPMVDRTKVTVVGPSEAILKCPVGIGHHWEPGRSTAILPPLLCCLSTHFRVGEHGRAAGKTPVPYRYSRQRSLYQGDSGTPDTQRSLECQNSSSTNQLGATGNTKEDGDIAHTNCSGADRASMTVPMEYQILAMSS